MTKTFAELVREKVGERTKTDHMIDLLPDFDVGIRNGHALSDLCLFLAESDGPFKGQTLESIKGIYYHARKKTQKAESGKRGSP